MDIRGFFGNNNKDKSVPAAGASSVKTNPKHESKPNTSHPNNSSSTPVKSITSLSTDLVPTKTQIIDSKATATIGDVTWSGGDNIPYAAVVSTFEFISSSSARLDKESLFCKLFVAIIKTKPEDLDCVVHLASNTLGPAYEGLELGIGDSLLVKAICEGNNENEFVLLTYFYNCFLI